MASSIMGDQRSSGDRRRTGGGKIDQLSSSTNSGTDLGRMKRGREFIGTGWKQDNSVSGQEHLGWGGGPSKKKKGDSDSDHHYPDLVGQWTSDKTVRDLAVAERILPKEFVWDTEETR